MEQQVYGKMMRTFLAVIVHTIEPASDFEPVVFHSQARRQSYNY
jgi:hypothetical protein